MKHLSENPNVVRIANAPEGFRQVQKGFAPINECCYISLTAVKCQAPTVIYSPANIAPVSKIMSQFAFHAPGLEDTDRLGSAIAEVVPAGTLIALSGTLGAGKTRLVQAIAAGCGVDRADVVSPTFVLCQEYAGDRQLVHIDAYRIADDDEFLQLGVDDYFDSDAIVLIEWAERVVSCLPSERIEIEIEVVGETVRNFNIRALGEGLSPVVVQMNRSLE